MFEFQLFMHSHVMKDSQNDVYGWLNQSLRLFMGDGFDNSTNSVAGRGLKQQ